MYKSFGTLIVTSILSLLLISGCVSYPKSPADIFGVGFSDLEKAKKNGITKEVNLSKSDAFDKILNILDQNKLIIYKKDLKNGYIIVMGLPKQTNTTRLGIFIEESSKEKTIITISSLSSTALAKGEEIVLNHL